MAKRTPFSKFETLAQRLVEGSFNRLLGGRLEPLDIAARVARAMEDSQVDGWAAGVYEIALHPDDFDVVRRQTPDIAEQLGRYVTRLAQQANLTLSGQPHITLTADPTLRRHQVQVTPKHGKMPKAVTTQIKRLDSVADEILKAITAVDAYLIIDGRRHIPLDKPLISIGRRTDNDIVLDSPTVSRRHAQIRWRYSRFVLYDLSNRGRTRVNGQPVNEYVLQSGDVIALSNVMLIYAEDHTKPRQSPRPNELSGDTQLLNRTDE